MQKSFLQETRNAQIIDILQSTKAYLAAVIAFVLTPSSSQLRKFPVGQLCLFNWKRVLKFVEIVTYPQNVFSLRRAASGG